MIEHALSRPLRSASRARSGPPGRRSPALAALLAAALALAACGHPPVDSGPAIVVGEALEPGAPSTGAAEAGAPRGPLELGSPTVTLTDEGWRWGVELRNPSTVSMGATVVVRLLDAEGRTLAYAQRVRRLDHGERWEVDATEAAPAEVIAAVTSWRLETWVRLLDRPELRSLRGIS